MKQFRVYSVVLALLFSLAYGERALIPEVVVGQEYSSQNQKYYLIMQQDGNLVVYEKKALWSTGTAGNLGAESVMQADGNLVIRATDGRILWSSDIKGYHGNFGEFKNFTKLQADGNYVIYGHAPLWSSGTAGNHGATLDFRHGKLMIKNNGQVIWSVGPHNSAASYGIQPDGDFAITDMGIKLWSAGTGGNPGAKELMQADGNLVVYAKERYIPLWDSGTYNHPHAKPPVMQADGNFVIYEAIPLWNSGTEGNNGATLHLLEDGNLIIDEKTAYGKKSRVIWSSKTNIDINGNMISKLYRDFYLTITNDGKVQIRAKKSVSGVDTLLWANGSKICTIYFHYQSSGNCIPTAS